MKMLIGVASALALLAAAPASADMANSLRVGVSVGSYQLNASRVTALNPDGSVVCIDPADPSTCFDSSSSGDAEFSYGLLGGYRITFGPGLFVDAGRELLNTGADAGGGDELKRTDYLLSGGATLGNFSVFGGYRMGQQSKDYFDDDIFEESGPFVGAGVAFPGNAVSFSASLAYGFNDAEFGGTDFEFDYNGISARIGLGFTGTGHSLQLRYQNYDGDGETPVPDTPFRLRVELEETYTQLAYIYSFFF